MIMVKYAMAMGLLGLSALAAPAPSPAPAPELQQTYVPGPAQPSSDYWMASIERNGKAAFHGDPDSYKIFRNVKDFGAVGDGIADDTAAINQAISVGGRCGHGCDSSTTTPAIIYLPPGTYKVSAPIVQFYYTQIIGDALNPPTLLASPDFAGMAVIDANPYDANGVNSHTNQNNFFRQIRNLNIDLRQMPPDRGAGIHWQIAQATSLQRITFHMHEDKSEANKQLGIFMDNGSGGFMTDLVFNGGQYGAFFGSQQFTTRNLTFNNCRTAVFMNWNWGWALHGITVNNCDVGVDIANSGEGFQTVGSVLLLDSTISDTPVGVATVYDPASPHTNGTLIIENVDMSRNVPVAVANAPAGRAPTPILPGNRHVASFVQGRVYQGSAGGGQAVQEAGDAAVTKPPGLLDAAGRVFTRAKPQYEHVPASSFVSVKAHGAVGDGKTDDTDAIQEVLDAAGPDDVIYFDHGAYLITRTVNVPKNARITGEHWPLLMAAGTTAFQDQNNPRPMLRVGRPGDVGNVEITELMIETQGPQPGAVLMEWNVAAESPGSAGMWDTHFRIGGTAGTRLQSDRCAKSPAVDTSPDPGCFAAFLLLHLTRTGSGYFENDWFWVSDHELDLPDHGQINIYNGRGVLVESTKPSWFWGTASEHSVLYNYLISSARNLYMSMIQTETAYFQGNPDARRPFAVQQAFVDPDFETLCSAAAPASPTCARTQGLSIVNSTDVFVYGGGLYSFFDNYGQDCVDAQNCQDDMVYVEDSSRVHLFGLSTKAAVNMVRLDGQSVALDADNRNNFCATLAYFSSE